MFNFWKKLFSDPTADWPKVVHDPLLGELRLVNDASWWESTIVTVGQPITFQIGGKETPNAVSLSQAHDIIENFEQFQHDVHEFLQQQAVSVSHLRFWTNEISRLKIETVSLFWPKQPENGMICFHGPDEYRLWRCDYVDGKFAGLAFDD